jgi:hypothetical protein
MLLADPRAMERLTELPMWLHDALTIRGSGRFDMHIAPPQKCSHRFKLVGFLLPTVEKSRGVSVHYISFKHNETVGSHARSCPEKFQS